MTTYRMNTQCTHCAAALRVAAAKVEATSGRTLSSVHCPICGARLSLKATCGVQDLSIQVMAYEERSHKRSGLDRRGTSQDRRERDRRSS